MSTMSVYTQAAKITCGLICIAISIPCWFLIGFWMSQPYSTSNRLSTQLFLYPAVGFLFFGCVLMCGDADEEEGNKDEVTPVLGFREDEV